MPNKPSKEGDPFRGIKTGSWTKWGGGRNNLIRSQSEKTWCCQLCGEDQPMSLAGYFLKDELSGEYMKVCSKCYSVSNTTCFSFRKTMVIVRGNIDKGIDDEVKQLLTAWRVM